MRHMRSYITLGWRNLNPKHCTQEAERTLFLISSLASTMGGWQLTLPEHPTAMRRAAAAFLEFAASPVRHPNERFFCPPVSAAERAAALLPSPLPLDDGACAVCAAICQCHVIKGLEIRDRDGGCVPNLGPITSR